MNLVMSQFEIEDWKGEYLLRTTSISTNHEEFTKNIVEYVRHRLRNIYLFKDSHYVFNIDGAETAIRILNDTMRPLEIITGLNKFAEDTVELIKKVVHLFHNEYARRGVSAEDYPVSKLQEEVTKLLKKSIVSTYLDKINIKLIDFTKTKVTEDLIVALSIHKGYLNYVPARDREEEILNVFKDMSVETVKKLDMNSVKNIYSVFYKTYSNEEDKKYFEYEFPKLLKQNTRIREYQSKIKEILKDFKEFRKVLEKYGKAPDDENKYTYPRSDITWKHLDTIRATALILDHIDTKGVKGINSRITGNGEPVDYPCFESKIVKLILDTPCKNGSIKDLLNLDESFYAEFLKPMPEDKGGDKFRWE